MWYFIFFITLFKKDENIGINTAEFRQVIEKKKGFYFQYQNGKNSLWNLQELCILKSSICNKTTLMIHCIFITLFVF